MAELLLITEDGPRYKNGNILCAFNNHRIRCVRIDELGHVREAGFNSDGLRPIDSCAYYVRLLTHQYMFRRIGASVERTNLFDNTVEIFSPPDIYVDAYIRRQIRFDNHVLFGTTDNEVWFGGDIATDDKRLDTVWEKITSYTGLIESDERFGLWYYGDHELKSHLAIRTEDFDYVKAEELIAPPYEKDKNGDFVWNRYETVIHKIEELNIRDPKPPDDLFDWQLIVEDISKENPVGSWFWIAKEDAIIETVNSLDVPDDIQDWRKIVIGKRDKSINWEAQFLPDLEVSKTDVLDKSLMIGKTLFNEKNNVIYCSKDQPVQINIDSKLDTVNMEAILQFKVG